MYELLELLLDGVYDELLLLLEVLRDGVYDELLLPDPDVLLEGA